MKKLLSLLAVVATVAGVQWAAAPANAADTPYPDSVDVQVSITLDHSSITGGKVLHIAATSTAGSTTPEGTLTVNAFGHTYTSENNAVSVDVKTPKVDKDTLSTVTAKFVGAEIADGAAAHSSVVVPAVFTRTATVVNAASIYKTATASATVTLLAADSGDGSGSGSGSGSSDGSGILPNTGGPSWTLIALGALLLLLGAAIVASSRRRQLR